MKSVKKMLLGFAFLLIALMGAILHESDFGYILFCVGGAVGILLCLVGCFEEQLAALIKKLTAQPTDGDDKDEGEA